MTVYRNGTIRRDGGKSMQSRKRTGFGARFNEYMKKQGKGPLQTDLIDKLDRAGDRLAKDFAQNKDKYVLEGQCVMTWFQHMTDPAKPKEERSRILKLGPYNYGKTLFDLSHMNAAAIQRMNQSAFAALKSAVAGKRIADTVLGEQHGVADTTAAPVVEGTSGDA